MELVERANEWLEKSFAMTEDERKQYKIARGAFLKVSLTISCECIRTIELRYTR